MSMMPGNPTHRDADFPYPGQKRGLSESRDAPCSVLKTGKATPEMVHEQQDKACLGCEHNKAGDIRFMFGPCENCSRKIRPDHYAQNVKDQARL